MRVMVGGGLRRNNLGLPKFCCELGNFFAMAVAVRRVIILVRIRRHPDQFMRHAAIVGHTYADCRSADTQPARLLIGP
jgi:hypothetical protein